MCHIPVLQFDVMGNSIKEISEKIKASFRSDGDDVQTLLVALMFILLGTAAFGLGRLSLIPPKQPITVENTSQLASPAPAPEAESFASQEVSSEMVVASKKGTKYHYPWCSGAKSIAEENKITFNSPEEARDAGYTPAANCKGLK